MNKQVTSFSAIFASIEGRLPAMAEVHNNSKNTTFSFSYYFSTTFSLFWHLQNIRPHYNCPTQYIATLAIIQVFRI